VGFLCPTKINADPDPNWNKALKEKKNPHGKEELFTSGEVTVPIFLVPRRTKTKTKTKITKPKTKTKPKRKK
jgi:hypothetical protein